MPPPLGTSADAGEAGGGWLFKDKDLLMGPVPASVLIKKLNDAEISPETPVASEEDEEWTKLRDVPFFNVHVAKAEARLRVMHDKAEEEQSQRRAKVARWSGVAAVATLVMIVVAAGAIYLVKRNAGPTTSDELAELPITVSPPMIALVSKSGRSADAVGTYLDVDVDDRGESGAPGTTPKGKLLAKGKTQPKGRLPKGKTPPQGKTALASAAQDPSSSKDVQMLRSYDMPHINSVVRKQSRTLFPCIKAEVRRTGFKGTIPFEFVIQNNGRVGKIWIDNKQLRGTPMEGCFKTTMAKWKFKSFPGERPTVSQSFTIGG